MDKVRLVVGEIHLRLLLLLALLASLAALLVAVLGMVVTAGALRCGPCVTWPVCVSPAFVWILWEFLLLFRASLFRGAGLLFLRLLVFFGVGGWCAGCGVQGENPLAALAPVVLCGPSRFGLGGCCG